MPYRRRSRRRKRKSSFFNKARSVASTAFKAYKVAKYVKSLVNVEKKFIDRTLDAELISTGNVDHLNQIAQGDGHNQRDGHSVKGYQVDILGTLKPHASTPTDCYVRMMLVLDTQQIADTPVSISDVLGTSFGIPTMLNQETLGRYTILWNYIVPVEINSRVPVIKFHRKISFKTRFNGTATNDIQKNGLFLCCFSDQSTGTGPTLNYHARYRFIDN